jgi:peptide/nickel transport system permease protein
MHAIASRDITMIQASVVFFSAVFVFGNMLADMAYAFLDPRVRIS